MYAMRNFLSLSYSAMTVEVIAKSIISEKKIIVYVRRRSIG